MVDPEGLAVGSASAADLLMRGRTYRGPESIIVICAAIRGSGQLLRIHSPPRLSSAAVVRLLARRCHRPGDRPSSDAGDIGDMAKAGMGTDTPTPKQMGAFLLVFVEGSTEGGGFVGHCRQSPIGPIKPEAAVRRRVYRVTASRPDFSRSSPPAGDLGSRPLFTWLQRLQRRLYA